MRSSRPSSASAALRALLGLCFVLGSASACTTGATPAASPAGLTVGDAWVRAAPTTGGPTGAYLVIVNPAGQADALISVSSPAAGMVQMHQTTTDMNGMTGMSEIPRLDVPAGATVRLAPGGYHLMMMGLKAPLAVGATVELDLVFEHAGKVVVQAAVRAG
jgi:hypothetical protein